MPKTEKEKNTIVLFVDTWLDAVETFEPEEIGRLLVATLNYFTGEVVPDFPDRAMNITFRQVKRQVDYQKQAYSKRIIDNTYSGYCSGIKRANAANPDGKQETILDKETWYREI